MSEKPNPGFPGQAGAEVAVGKEGGLVLLAIRQNATGRVDWARLPPEVALGLGEQLAKDAYVALYGTEPPPNALKDAVIERKRQKLINRLPLILRQLREKKRDDVYIATTLIDRVLAEVLS